MTTEALAELKKQCQSAADAFQRLQANHGGLPHAQLDFNYATLLALKAIYETIVNAE